MGLWRAQALAKDIGESSEKITMDTIRRIHQVFFGDTFPEIAGKFRKDGQDIKKLRCIEPPPGRMVEERIYQFWREFDYKISTTPRSSANLSKKKKKEWLDRVFHLAAWTQHQIAAIHPFCEGNGRMARIMTNLVLRRFGLQPSQIKYEGEDKKRYLDALCQIDHFGNYEPLTKLIAESVFSTYKRIEDLQKRQIGQKRMN
jgi:fido (protein-threonine AMPylation protein)